MLQRSYYISAKKTKISRKNTPKGNFFNISEKDHIHARKHRISFEAQY